MKIVAFTRYGDRAASTRQRLLQYAPALDAAGIALTHHPLLDDDYMLAIAQGQQPSRKAVLASYARRLRRIPKWVRDADMIWVYAELLPYLPAFVEGRIFRHGVPVVYDFDDAFFMSYKLNRSPVLRALLGGKFEATLRQSAAVFCGNEYLQSYARQFAPKAIYLPTVVDSDEYATAPRDVDRRLAIGWIGSPSTWRYVIPLLPMLQRFCEQHDVEFRVVGAGIEADAAAATFPHLKSLPWVHASEIADIQAMDIGIMPAIDEPWALGKCGYKLIQYMASGMPVVASPIGAANQIVSRGVNGFLANDWHEWEQALAQLVRDARLRTDMGRAGRLQVERDYSLRTHAPRFIAELQALARSR